MTPLPFPRFTSSTSTFRGKSASRSPRLWARATVCRCSKPVSGVSWASNAGRRRPDCPCLSLLPQPSVKWVWGFATTSDLQNWRSSTAGQVRFWPVVRCGFGAVQLTRPCFCLQVLSCWSTPEPSTWRPARLTGSYCRGRGRTNAPRNKLTLKHIY